MRPLRFVLFRSLSSRPYFVFFLDHWAGSNASRSARACRVRAMAEVLAGVSVVKLLQLEALFQGRVAGQGATDRGFRGLT